MLALGVDHAHKLLKLDLIRCTIMIVMLFVYYFP